MTDLNHSSESNLPEKVLRQLAHGFLLGFTRTRISTESPPETALAAVVRFLLVHEVDQGRILVHQRERLVLPTEPALDVEVDLLLHQPSTGARGVVETVGWAWHRRTQPEFQAEIRRERLIRRHMPVEIFTASEVLDNPWTVALEIVDLFGTAWPAFERVHIPPTVLSIAESFAGRTETTARSGALPPPKPEGDVLSILDRLRDVVRGLSVADLPTDPALQAIRRDYPRAYEPWQAAEVEGLARAFYTWIDVDDIAAALQRSPGAVWKQLRRMGLVNG